MFNRYEILDKFYKSQLSQLDWDKIKQEAKTNCRLNEDRDSVYGSYFLGTTLGVYPSGKIYAPWTTNQTRADVTKDGAFIEALESLAEAKGMFVDYDDDSVSLCLHIEKREDCIMFITSEDKEAADELFRE